MARKHTSRGAPDVSRRKFIAGAALTGAAAVSSQAAANAAAGASSSSPPALRPGIRMAAAEAGIPDRTGRTSWSTSSRR